MATMTSSLHENSGLAIFLHLGDVTMWDCFESYLQRIPFKFDLHVNFCEDLCSSNSISKCKEDISTKYEDVRFYVLPNRGCDIGPFFYFMDTLRKENIKYKWILKLHTKTDEEWRTRMLESLIPEDFQSFYDSLLQNPNAKIVGSFQYAYDYVNLYYDLRHLNTLGLKVNTTWDTYSKMFPVTQGKSPLEKGWHALLKPEERIEFVPQIDVETYTYLFGAVTPNGGRLLRCDHQWEMLFRLLWHKLSGLHYFPGTCFIVNHEAFENVYQKVDLLKIYNSLEEGKPDDRVRPTIVHSWERIIPMSFQLTYGKTASLINKVDKQE